MDILLLLIPLSVVLALLIGAGFWWSVKSGQFDDLEGPAHRILADDDRILARTASDADKQKEASAALISVNPPQVGGQ
jgi:cbb3-type cytochrome oxidase maturation protein